MKTKNAGIFALTISIVLNIFNCSVLLCILVLKILRNFDIICFLIITLRKVGMRCSFWNWFNNILCILLWLFSPTDPDTVCKRSLVLCVQEVLYYVSKKSCTICPRSLVLYIQEVFYYMSKKSWAICPRSLVLSAKKSFTICLRSLELYVQEVLYYLPRSLLLYV